MIDVYIKEITKESPNGNILVSWTVYRDNNCDKTLIPRLGDTINLLSSDRRLKVVDVVWNFAYNESKPSDVVIKVKQINDETQNT